MSDYDLQEEGEQPIDNQDLSPAANIDDVGSDDEISEVDDNAEQSDVGDESDVDEEEVNSGEEEDDDAGTSDEDADSQAYSDPEDYFDDDLRERKREEEGEDEEDDKYSVYSATTDLGVEAAPQVNKSLHPTSPAHKLTSNLLQNATNGAGSAALPDLKEFADLSIELQYMIWNEATGHDGPIEHRIAITRGKSSTGEVIYLAQSHPPNPIAAVCAGARLAFRPDIEYAILRPQTDAGEEQPDIIFDPARDTLHFHSNHFPDAYSVSTFLNTLTQKSRDKIQNVAFRHLDQSWVDDTDPPAANTLAMMNDLSYVIILEDERGVNDAEAQVEGGLHGRYMTAKLNCENFADENEGWNQPELEFKVDPHNR